MNGLNLEEKYEKDQRLVHTHNKFMALQRAVDDEYAAVTQVHERRRTEEILSTV